MRTEVQQIQRQMVSCGVLLVCSKGLRTYEWVSSPRISTGPAGCRIKGAASTRDLDAARTPVRWTCADALGRVQLYPTGRRPVTPVWTFVPSLMMMIKTCFNGPLGPAVDHCAAGGGSVGARGPDGGARGARWRRDWGCQRRLGEWRQGREGPMRARKAAGQVPRVPRGITAMGASRGREPSICQHNRQRSRCKDCGGASILRRALHFGLWSVLFALAAASPHQGTPLQGLRGRGHLPA